MTNAEVKDGRGRLALVYKLPSEPGRYRASVWRKPRATGVVYLRSGVAALPDDPAGERTMRGVLREIREVERELKACREDLESFAASVHEAADHGSADSS